MVQRRKRTLKASLAHPKSVFTQIKVLAVKDTWKILHTWRWCQKRATRHLFSLMSVPPPLLGQLLEIKTSLQEPEQASAICAAAHDASVESVAGSTTVAEVFRFASGAGLDGAGLSGLLTSAEPGEAATSMLADYWAALPGRESLIRPAPSRLLDVNWSFGVSASSSNHAALGTTFVQLRLHVSNAEGAHEYVHMELNLAGFYDFLHQLEQAKVRLELTP